MGADGHGLGSLAIGARLNGIRSVLAACFQSGLDDHFDRLSLTLEGKIFACGCVALEIFRWKSAGLVLGQGLSMSLDAFLGDDKHKHIGVLFLGWVEQAILGHDGRCYIESIKRT